MTTIEFVNERLDAMLARPKMWGGAEAIELQVILLLEFLAKDALPDQDPNEWIMRRYLPFIRKALSSNAPWLLSGHFSSDVDSLVKQLAAFRALVTRELDRSPRQVFAPAP